MVQRGLELGHDGVPRGGVLLGLLGVATDHVAAALDDGFLHLEILGHLPVAPGAREHDLGDFLLLAQPAAEDIVERSGGVVREQRQRALGDHAAVGHHDDPPDPEAFAQAGDHRDEGGVIPRVARQDVPRHRPAVPIHCHAEHDLRLVGPAIARVAAAAQRGLRVAPDERARGVEEEEVELLRKEVPVLPEERALEVFPDLRQEAADGAVEMLERNPLEAGALDGLEPLHPLEVASRRAEPLEREREGRALDVEGEVPLGGEPPEDGGDALVLPQPAEHERGAPGPGGVGLEARRAHALHDAQPLAEAGQGPHESVQRAVGHELVAPAEGGADPLPDVAPAAHGLDDLEVLVGAGGLDTTLHPHEHAGSATRFSSRRQ